AGAVFNYCFTLGQHGCHNGAFGCCNGGLVEEELDAHKLGGSHLEGAINVHEGTQSREREEVSVEAAATYDVASGRRQYNFAGSRDHGARKEDACTDLFGKVHRDFGGLYVQATDAYRSFFGLAGDCGAEALEDLEEDFDVLNVGYVLEHHFFVGEQRRCNAGEGGVFVAAGLDGPANGKSAFDGVLEHTRDNHWKASFCQRRWAAAFRLPTSFCACTAEQTIYFCYCRKIMKVMKFGGSSVKDAGRIRTVLEIVRQNPGSHIVCSAMKGVTDQLIGLARCAETGDERFARDLDDLRTRHFETYKELLGV